MARRLRIGLTGGIASGKSSAAQRFLELGIAVVDADESARRVVAPGTPGLADVVRCFGEDVLDVKGKLDRRKVRDLIFSDPNKRRTLETILHPLIRDDMEYLVGLASSSYVVMAVPLLIESGASDRIDRILVVDVPEDVQVQRVIARDGATSDQARAILTAQASRDKRLQCADDILVNVGTLAELQQGIDELHQRYLQLAADTS